MPTLLDAAGLPIPQSVTGRSVLPLMRGEDVAWREALHGEHAGQYDPDDANHYLVDGHTKYVWHDQTGEELLFDLDNGTRWSSTTCYTRTAPRREWRRGGNG